MNQTSRQPTLSQQRAAHALQQIQSIANDDGMYVSYVSALPATVVMNGLGQALIVQLAKSKKESDSHQLLYNHVTAWLTQQIPELAGDTQSLLQRLMDADQSVYLHAQTETMGYLNWLKQFARAYLHDKGENPGE